MTGFEHWGGCEGSGERGFNTPPALECLVSDGSSWVQPIENTIPALTHGINFLDGVELDLRLSSDGELMLYHDDLMEGSESKRDRCLELLDSSEISSRGITRFEELIATSEFSEPWVSGSKTVNIELKVPHPVAQIKDHATHLISMMNTLDEALSDLDLPSRSTLVYGFSPKIGLAAKRSELTLPSTQLSPHLRSWGKTKLKRFIGSPNFVSNSVARLIRDRRKKGMPVIGMALHYIHGWERLVHLGMPVSLTGKGLQRLFSISKEMGVHVWPAPLSIEELMLDAGLTLVTDHVDPTIHTLPTGKARWPRPASQPIDAEWLAKLNSASGAERIDVQLEAADSLPMWHELPDSARAADIISDAKRFSWSGSPESYAHDLEDGRPWGCARIIGHRGSGETH